MPKPILLAIDDDTSVLEAVVQDLRRHYGQDYRIVRAASGAAALDICRQLQRAQGHGRTLPLRPAHARNDRSRLPPAGAHHLPRRQTRPPDRLRRHRSRNPRHQLRQDPLLPQQAVGPARREALPGAGRPARNLETGLQASVRRNSRRRPTLVACGSRRPRLPLPQPHPLPVAQSRRQHPEALDLLKEKGLDDSKLPVVVFGDGTAIVQPNSTRSGQQGGTAAPGPAEVLRRRRRRRRSGRPRRGRLRRLRGPRAR